VDTNWLSARLVASLVAIAFYFSVEFFTALLLQIGTEYSPPLPGGFQDNHGYNLFIQRPWLIPLICGLGGLLVGLITTRFSPESEGHGTDAVIDAYHHKRGNIRGRVPLVKAVASSITIGSGGSAGIFGPSMVIGGLVGAFISTAFHMMGLFTWIDVSSVIIVAMVSFFGATAKTLISSIIMGSELAGGYALLAPMMLATFIAYIMSGQHNSIFRSQVVNRSGSPAHRMEYQLPILSDLYVRGIFKEATNKLPKMFRLKRLYK